MYENRQVKKVIITNSYSQIIDIQQNKPNNAKLDSAKGPVILFGFI